MSAAIEIRKVENDKMIKEFILLPWKLKIYKNNPHWIPPVIKDMKDILNPKKGPFYDDGEAELYMAYRNGKPVGRISAHVNHLWEKKYDNDTGFFGFYESINDQEVADALYKAAEFYVKQKGKTRIIGPFGFNIYDQVGFDIDGFDITPVIGLLHFAPYYKDLAGNYGFKKLVDWGCYLVDGLRVLEPYMKEVLDRYDKEHDVVYKMLNKKNKKELEKRKAEIMEIFNVAWEGNWGHLHMSKKWFDMMFHELMPIAINELVYFAEKDGKTVGFIISIPDANAALQALDGRLYPWRILKALRVAKKSNRIRTIIMGVLPEYRGQKIDDYFYIKTVIEGLRLGFEASDCSLVVETNKKMIGALKPLNAVNYKNYRVYEKPVK